MLLYSNPPDSITTVNTVALWYSYPQCLVPDSIQFTLCWGKIGFSNSCAMLVERREKEAEIA